MDTVSQSAVGAIIGKLSSGSDAEKAAAAYDIEQLAADSENQRLLGQAGAIPPPLVMVGNGTDEQKRLAASALRYMAEDSENQMAIVLAQAVGPLIALARDGTEAQKECGANALGQLAANNAANQKLIGCAKVSVCPSRGTPGRGPAHAFSSIPRAGSKVQSRRSPSSCAAAPPTRQSGPRRRSATWRLYLRIGR